MITAVRTSHAVYAVAHDNAPGYQPTPAQIAQVRDNLEASGGVGFDADPMLKKSDDCAAMSEYFDLSDTLIDGIGALRLAGEKYMPKFVDEDGRDYAFRLKSTKMTNIYRDTVEGLASKPFEEEIALHVDDDNTVPDALEQFIENVDGSGNNLTIFSSATFFNGINSAIDWIWVDYSKADPSIRSVADLKAAGLRPFWSHVLGRNVYDVKSKIIAGKEIITYIKIFEPGKPQHIRIFKRYDTGLVRWALFEKTETEHDLLIEWFPDGVTPPTGKTKFVLIDEGSITIDTIPLIPFITGRRDGRTWRFFPAMRDAADLQVELYQQESALKFIKILAAYPMLAGNGVKPEYDEGTRIPKKLAVGPGRVLYAPHTGEGRPGSWSYVEPAATTMTFLAADVKETQQQLRELGRQPLTAQSGNLTVITTAVAAGKGKSAVKAWALGLKDALENALVITAKWLAIDAATYDPVVNVYTEFDEFLDGKDLDTLNAARYPSNGTTADISQETYWEELKRRGVLSPEFDAETEQDRLLNELPGDGEDMTNVDPKTGLPILPSDPLYKPPGVKPPVRKPAP